MPLDLTKIPKLLIDAAASRNLVPFIGAGVSRQAKMKGSKGFPTWIELIKELVDLALLNYLLSEEDSIEIERLLLQEKYLMVAQYLKATIPEDHFDVYIRKRFDTSNVEVGAIHRALFKLKSPLILTTNYDQLLEKAYVQEFTQPPHWSTHSPYTQVAHVLKYRRDLDKPILFHLHGSADRPSDIVFTEMNYRKIYGNARYRTMLSTIFLTKVVLMLGFSFTDPDLMRLVGDLRFLFGEGRPDYIFLPQSEKTRIEKFALLRGYGLELIGYEPSDGHPELLELVEYLASFVPPQTITASQSEM